MSPTAKDVWLVPQNIFLSPRVLLMLSVKRWTCSAAGYVCVWAFKVEAVPPLYIQAVLSQSTRVRWTGAAASEHTAYICLFLWGSEQTHAATLAVINIQYHRETKSWKLYLAWARCMHMLEAWSKQKHLHVLAHTSSNNIYFEKYR